MVNKECSRCGCVLPLEQFGKDARMALGRQSWCRCCTCKAARRSRRHRGKVQRGVGHYFAPRGRRL